uniref:Myb family transcription factor family protein n=1 Tax=Rhizophora mucronata TaxID=61149 RepID=A0A2P2LCC0_RHIMU
MGILIILGDCLRLFLGENLYLAFVNCMLFLFRFIQILFEGHGRQGGWHPFAEESGHGYAPSRCNDKMLEDENYRPSVSRDENYNRSSKEHRGSLSQRDLKGYSWEMSNGSPNMPSRLHDVSNVHRSVDDMLTSSTLPPTHSEFVNTWEQLHLKDQHDNSKMDGVNGLGTGQRCDKDNSLDWKPLKWNRSGSLSSRGSGFSHSSSSKSIGGADSGEGKAELRPKNVILVQSPSADAAARVTSVAPSEETTSRKKPRLNWGEGLAKYEKKKVEGPEVSASKDGAIISVVNAEPILCQSSNLADKSPRVPGFSDCASPATPSSVACSSSPGIEEKTSGKAMNGDIDATNLCSSHNVGSQNHLEGISFNLEKLDISSISNLGTSLIELLQSDDPNSMDSCFVRSSAIKKLLLLRNEVSKALEITESEIDSLENELKSLKFEPGSRRHNPATSSSFPGEGSATPFNGHSPTFNKTTCPCPLQVLSCNNENVQKFPLCNGAIQDAEASIKCCDIDSPGTATSKFVEPESLTLAAPPVDMMKHAETTADLDVVQPTNMWSKHLLPCTNEEATAVFACQDVHRLIESKSSAASSTDASLHIDGVDNLCKQILASNKELAVQASEVFTKLLPKDHCKIDLYGMVNSSSWQSDALVKEKFANRKQFLRFKERVITLKFKAFHHLWKEDMRLLSVRKFRAKSHKKSELSLRTTHIAYQKHRSSHRSRFPSPAGSVSVVPTIDMPDVSSVLLSDGQVKLYRDTLKMPALILDKKEKLASRFISINGLVEDPCGVEKERASINPWTPEEREIFIEKLATFGKDFRKIASFLDHKTTADCVQFYYKNHKSDCFEKTKKIKEVKSSTNYLVASNKKWNREINAASLDILGAASVIAADADNAMRRQKMYSGRIFLGGYGDMKTSQSGEGILERSRNFNATQHNSETAAADVLAGICGSMSSEAMSSCGTTSVDPGESYWEMKSQKFDSVMKQPSTSDVTQNVEQEDCSDDSCEMDPTDWTDKEKSIFVQAVSSYGKDFAMISRCVRTRSRDQCKVFFSKARKCLGLDMVYPGPRDLGIPMSDDANGGGSDSEDACGLETSSVVCNYKLGSKTDEDLPLSSMHSKQEESDAVTGMHTDLSRSVDNKAKVAVDQESKVVDTLVHDECRMESIPELRCDIDKQTMNGFVHQPESVWASKVSTESVDVEGNKVAGDGTLAEPMHTGDALSAGLSYPHAMSVATVVGKVSMNGIRDDVKRQEISFPENGLSRQKGFLQGSNDCHLPVDSGSCSSMCQVSVELDSVENPSVSTLPPESNLATATSVFQNMVATRSEKIPNQDSLYVTCDLKDSSHKQEQESVIKDDFFQHLSGNPLLTCDKSSHVLRGFPRQIPTKKEMKEGISCRPLSGVQSQLNGGRNITNHFVSQDCFLQKCSGLKAQGELLHLPQNNEQSSDHGRDHSQTLSDTEKPCRNGDVKLFGQILSNPSSSQDRNPDVKENDGKGTHNPRLSSKTAALKFASHNNTDGNTALLKFDCDSGHGLDNVPIRSYGFWDGSRIQTGFSSLPDSAILLAKYPAAFGNYHASSAKLEQQALQAVVKSSEHNLNGISVVPPRDAGGSNGVGDYQTYRSHDATKAQPFTVEMKHRQDIFPEMQGRNGLEAISGIQQQGRGMVGMNVVGGILVGGPCAGVSDPVAAIKMQYAKADQCSGHNGTIMREEESWRV